jgi:hypothetical protein
MASINLLGMFSKAFGDPTTGGGDPDTPYMKPGAKERIPGLVDEYIKYIKSPLYSQRLSKMKVEKPGGVVADRVRQLRRADVSIGPSAHFRYGFTDKFRKEQGPMIQVRKNESDYTAMHEVAHTTNHGDDFFANPIPGVKPGNENTASGKGMSFNEMMYLVSRLKSPNARKSVIERFNSAKKLGVFTNAADGLSGDSHSFDPSELKSDLDAMRLLFKRYGVTKSFGENISKEQMEKAKKIKEVANEPHFKRMLHNYNEQEIIDINNNIAMAAKPVSTVA